MQQWNITTLIVFLLILLSGGNLPGSLPYLLFIWIRVLKFVFANPIGVSKHGECALLQSISKSANLWALYWWPCQKNGRAISVTSTSRTKGKGPFSWHWRLRRTKTGWNTNKEEKGEEIDICTIVEAK